LRQRQQDGLGEHGDRPREYECQAERDRAAPEIHAVLGPRGLKAGNKNIKYQKSDEHRIARVPNHQHVPNV